MTPPWESSPRVALEATSVATLATHRLKRARALTQSMTPEQRFHGVGDSWLPGFLRRQNCNAGHGLVMGQIKPKADEVVEVEATTISKSRAGSSPGSYGEPPPLAALPRSATDSYEVRAEHARGGLGRVLKAEDRRLHRLVAI